jgi:hypothetical protein
MTKRKDRQYNGQKKGQTMQWPKERTENTLTRTTSEIGHDYHFQSTRVHPWVFVAQSLVFCVVFCRSLFVLSFDQCIVQWPKQRTNNTMAKRKDSQYNDQKKGQTLQWPKERTDNTRTRLSQK